MRIAERLESCHWAMADAFDDNPVVRDAESYEVLMEHKVVLEGLVARTNNQPHQGFSGDDGGIFGRMASRAQGGALLAADTVTVTDAVTLLAELRAVSTYVVVAVGDIDRLVTPVTSPTALLMERLVAPVVAHDKVADCPAVMLDGVAEKLEIIGGDAAGGAAPLGLPPPPPPHAAIINSNGEIKPADRHRIVNASRLREQNYNFLPPH